MIISCGLIREFSRLAFSSVDFRRGGVIWVHGPELHPQ